MPIRLRALLGATVVLLADRHHAPPGYRTRMCTKTVTVAVAKRYRARLKSARVVIGGKRVATLSRKHPSRRIRISAAPGRQVTIKTIAKLRGGRTVTGTHRRQACA